MRKTLLIISILALFLVSADPVKLARLTLVNKSGMEIAVQLRSIEDDLLTYYLRVPEGDREHPYAMAFTIERDAYYMQLHYIETYDPVYGFKCTTPPPNQLVAFRNLRVVFLGCGEPPPNWGEPSMMKYLPVVQTAMGPGVMTTQCLPLPVRLGIIKKCWQTRLIY
ncbi:MAG: hypothetical protein JXA78_14045 [Anaerolineales bacterium]|nr:hypothetical protein [Anaerolineales bacterium]